MIRWTTPTLTIRLRNAEHLDLTTARNMYFTLEGPLETITKMGDSLEIETQTVKVYLSQEETGSLGVGYGEFQLNWTYTNGRRMATVPKRILITKNLLKEVVE